MGTNRKAIPLLLLFIACHPSMAAAGSKSHLLAYVQNIMSHSVSVIDLDGDQEPRRLELGRYPLFSALYPSGPEKLLVTLHNYERREDDDAMVLFDLRSERVLKRVPFPGPGMPSGFVHDARRSRIYIADENRHRVDALDAVTLDPVFEFPAGLIPVHVDISADGKWLAVTNRKSADLYVYDLEDPGRDAKTGIYAIHLGKSPGADWDTGAANEGISHPLDIHFAAEANLCYVSDMQARQLLVVDILKREVVGRIPLNGSPFDFVLDRARGRGGLLARGRLGPVNAAGTLAAVPRRSARRQAAAATGSRAASSRQPSCWTIGAGTACEPASASPIHSAVACASLPSGSAGTASIAPSSASVQRASSPRRKSSIRGQRFGFANGSPSVPRSSIASAAVAASTSRMRSR